MPPAVGSSGIQALTRIFISYDTDEALQHAIDTSRLLRDCGSLTWVWHENHSGAGYVQQEMARNICDSDYFLLICTARTALSKPQTYEREMAWYCDKVPPLLVTFESTHVPLEWRCYLRDANLQQSLEDKCVRICQYLEGQQKLRSEPTGVREGTAIDVSIVEHGTATESIVVEKR